MVFIVPIIDKNNVTTFCVLEDKHKWFFIEDYWEDVYNELKELNYQKFPRHAPKCIESKCKCGLSTATLQVKPNGQVLIYRPAQIKGLEMTLDYEEFPNDFVEWLLYKKPNDFELQSYYLKHVI